MATGGLMRLSSQVSLDAEYIGNTQNVQKQAVTLPSLELRDTESDESQVVRCDGYCSSMPSENWEEELEKCSEVMPKEIKGDFIDCLILYAEEDRNGAEQFRTHLINDIKMENHGPITAHLYDEFNPSAGSIISQLNESYDRSTFILIYMTQKLFEDKWTKLCSETCLMDSIDNEDKKWCIVPVYPKKKNSSFRVPLFFNHLKGINYYHINDNYKKNVAKMIKEKVYVRLRRIEKQKQQQKNWLQQYKQDHDKTKKKENRLDRIQQSQADSVIQLPQADNVIQPSQPDSVIQPSQADSEIQQSQADSVIQLPQADSVIQPSQADSVIQQSQADSVIQPSQADSGIQQSQANGGIQQFQADGRLQQSKADGRSQQSKADGGIQQSKADDRLQQSQADGRLQQSKADGRSQQSKADGRSQQSQADGGIQQSQADGRLQQSQADGRLQQSKADGRSQQSKADDRIQQSQAYGRSQLSQADGVIQLSQADSVFQPSQSDSVIQQSQADSVIQPSQADSVIQQSQADSVIQPSQADSGIQQFQAGGGIQQSQADGRLQQSKADGRSQQSKAHGRSQQSKADGGIQQFQADGGIQQSQAANTGSSRVSLEKDGESLNGKPSFPGNQMEQVGQVTFGLNRTCEKSQTNISQSTYVARVAPMIKNNALESRHGSETKAPSVFHSGQIESWGDVKPSDEKSNNVLTSGADVNNSRKDVTTVQTVYTSENQTESNMTLSRPNENYVIDSPTAFDNSSEFKEPQNGQPGRAWTVPFSISGFRNASRLFYYDRGNAAINEMKQ